MNPPETNAGDAVQSNLEMAYVLFMDIVGYSRMPTDVQQETLHRLQACVRGGNEFRKAQAQQRLLSLPTGDGMALAFFGDPESSVRCAVETTRELKKEKEIPLRMGLHAGPVYRVTDINANQNVAGDGINIAQRVMDCGDAGHILVSKAQTDVLRQLSGWMGALQDLGEVTVKHGVRVHVFNLVVEGAGNSQSPTKIAKAPSPFGRKQRLRTWTALGGAAIVLLAGSVIAIQRWWPTPKSLRPTIAVLGFKNQMGTKDLDWVSTSLAEGIAYELGAGNRMSPIPGQRIERMKIDLSLPAEGSYAEDTIQKIHGYLHCQYLVYGNFFDPGKAAGGRVQLDFRLQAADTGELIASGSETGTELGIRELAARVGAALRKKLELPGISMSESEEIQAAMPANAEANEFYAKGLAAMRAFDLVTAQKSLQRAITADPNFSLAHAAMAEVWKGFGYDGRAADEARRASELSARLGREDRSLVEARLYETTSQWEKSNRVYTALWSLYPENPDYALQAADVQIRAGKAQEALQTLAELRKQPGDLKENPLLDLREADAWESLGDFGKEEAAAEQGRARAKKRSARLAEGDALWKMCWALSNLGSYAEGKSACEQAQKIGEDTGYRRLVALSFTNRANIARGEGSLDEALKLYRQALQVAENIGSQRDVVGALNNVGLLLGSEGKSAEAVKSYDKAMAVAREIDDKSLILLITNNLAAESQAAGDYGGAAKLYDDALAMARSVGDKLGEARALGNSGNLDALLGRLEPAIEKLREAVSIASAQAEKADAEAFEYALGDAQLSSGDVDGARKSYEEALGGSTTSGQKTNMAVGWLSLANMEVQAGGDYQSALEQSKKAAAEFRTEGLRDLETNALTVEAIAELALNQASAAADTVKKARALESTDPLVRGQLGLAEVRVRLWEKRITDAKTELDSITKGLGKNPMLSMQFEVRLVDVEVLLRSGNRTKATEMIERLMRDADRSGFRLIGRRAERLARET